MRAFYLIRHGETDWNRRTKRLQGHTDIPLNDIGIAQAQSLAAQLDVLGITRFIASDLSRAHETAKIISLGRPIETDSRLREVKLGVVEGLAPKDIDQEYGVDFRKNWGSNFAHFKDLKFPGGESRLEVLIRAQALIHQFLDKYPDDTLAFVSHGFLIRSLVFEKPEITTDFFIPNCAVAPFVERDDRRIDYVGPLEPQDLIQPPLSLIAD